MTLTEIIHHLENHLYKYGGGQVASRPQSGQLHICSEICVWVAVLISKAPIQMKSYCLSNKGILVSILYHRGANQNIFSEVRRCVIIININTQK